MIFKMDIVKRKTDDDEIKDILTEFPVNGLGQKVQTYGKSKKPNTFKNKFKKLNVKAIIGIIFSLILIISFFMYVDLPQNDEEETCEICAVCVQKISLEDIKHQIITKGYVNIKDGNTVLKLSPYTG